MQSGPTKQLSNKYILIVLGILFFIFAIVMVNKIIKEPYDKKPQDAGHSFYAKSLNYDALSGEVKEAPLGGSQEALIISISEIQQQGLNAFSKGDFRKTSLLLSEALNKIVLNADQFDLSKEDVQNWVPKVNEWLAQSKHELNPQAVEDLRDRIEALDIPQKENPYFTVMLKQFLDSYLIKTIADQQIQPQA